MESLENLIEMVRLDMDNRRLLLQIFEERNNVMKASLKAYYFNTNLQIGF